VAIWGTPGRVADTPAPIEEEIGLTCPMRAPRGHSSFTMFTDKVMPRFLGAVVHQAKRKEPVGWQETESRG